MGEGGGSPSPVEIRPLRADEAPQLVRCFERCYGDTYVAEAFYDAERIRALQASGSLRSVVAVAGADGIVGHMALTIRDPQATTVDAGNTVVDPRYRGHALAARMAAALVTLCRDAGFVGFHHYPTTAHPVMQNLAVKGGGIETGIMLGYVPAGTEYRDLAEAASGGRLAVVIVYQPLAAAPARTVFAPERYRDPLTRLYEGARLERALRPPAASLSLERADVKASLEVRRSLLRIAVEVAGRDLGARVDELCRAQPADVVQVDLSLADAGVAVAVELLRRQGFFLAGLLPEYLRGDVLRLQRLAAGSPEVLTPDLATETGRALLAAITADRLG
jgi:GNAT superfamily N-acetyltransferase